MTKLNEIRNLENGQEISIRREDNAYWVYIDEEIFFTASLLECRAYAQSRIEGASHEEATEAAAEALEKKNSRPTEAQKAHELGMTIREYREHRRERRHAIETYRANHLTNKKPEVEAAIEKASKSGLDLSMDMMSINIKVNLTTGEIERMADRTEAEKEAELKLWANLWSQDLVAVKREAA